MAVLINLTVEQAKEIVDTLGMQRFLIKNSNLDNEQKGEFSDNIDRVIEILLEGQNV